MGELIVAFAAVGTAFALHLALWRIHLPRRQTRAILLLFFGTGGGTLALLPWLVASLPALGLRSPPALESYLSLAVFITAATLSYMITYSAVEADSPSLVMALAVRGAGPSGLSIDDFHARLDETVLLEPRMRDLVRDGLCRLEGHRYSLTPKGWRMARIFLLHRRLLGLGKGG